MTRFNFPQDEVFNPLGILLARHLTQLDETQRTATEETEENNGGDDKPRPEVADVVPANSATTPAGEPQELGNGEQAGEISGLGDGIVVRNSWPTDLPGDTPADNLGVMTGSALNTTFVGDRTSGTLDGRPPATDGVADQALTGASTLPEGVPEDTTITPIMRSE